MSPETAILGCNGVQGKPYPVALASHDDVVKDDILFLNTLRSFHNSLGSKFMVPVIGGKGLNLHVLYVEVTKRGGYDKVVTEKKWREISSVFDFSATTTSASYALRKHYFTLLHRYELVYFFRLQDTILAQTACSSFQAIGTIDAKFDCGYLVSIKVGDETLNGVLYHPSCHVDNYVLTPQPCNAVVPYTPQLHQSGRRNRRRRGRRAEDPGRPKPNRSGYNFFFAERHSHLKSLYPNREREFTKMIGESWNKLSSEERLIYQRHGAQDKERYQKEMKEYRERMKKEQPHY
ncbi:high mobility group B protein 9 [Dorcoceras hygrometricum]|uniref:High mobility group B protein 9 n=1 Tax=Dorcoceras hygrometricum TaxID=472368 RepID=A0A2Z7AFM9_9LAMI|nr:high mobility group B protein 9 [Dorcoceras hygrometricum]